MYAKYVRFALVALACAVAFWLGDRVASGRYEARIADISAAIAEAQVEAVERHNRALEAERKRADAAAAARSKQRQVAAGVTHEVVRDTDRSCEWRDLHRLRIEQLYGAYGYATDGSPSGVQDSVPAATVDRATP